MSKEKKIVKKENNSNDAPPATPGLEEDIINDYFTICPDCSSQIEILSINEENCVIQFRCIKYNKNYIMSIKDYLQKIKQIKNINIKDLKNKCKNSSHRNNNYVCYCLDCNSNLCNECLKTRIHINHRKTNIIEITPIKEELNIIEEVIKDYKLKLENLKKEQKQKTEKLKHLLVRDKNNENIKFQSILKSNETLKTNEIMLNDSAYISDIEQIKKRFENEIRIRKNKYENDYNGIINKYKLINEKATIKHKLKNEKLDNKYLNKINNFEFDKKIDNSYNILKINEMVFNIYNAYEHNYYNAVNISNLLFHYTENKYINDKIMKKILNDKYEEIIQSTKQKNNNENNKIKNLEENNIILEKKEKKKEIEKEEMKDIFNKNEEKYKIEINQLRKKVNIFF